MEWLSRCRHWYSISFRPLQTGNPTTDREPCRMPTSSSTHARFVKPHFPTPAVCISAHNFLLKEKDTVVSLRKTWQQRPRRKKKQSVVVYKNDLDRRRTSAPQCPAIATSKRAWAENEVSQEEMIPLRMDRDGDVEPAAVPTEKTKTTLSSSPVASPAASVPAAKKAKIG